MKIVLVSVTLISGHSYQAEFQFHKDLAVTLHSGVKPKEFNMQKLSTIDDFDDVYAALKQEALEVAFKNACNA